MMERQETRDLQGLWVNQVILDQKVQWAPLETMDNLLVHYYKV